MNYGWNAFPPKASSLEVHLPDVVTPFFLYHEAAHLLLNHSSSRSSEKETQADSLAFALFFASRGWRDAIDGELGLGELASTLLGPMFFLWVLNCFTHLELLTANGPEKISAAPFLQELAGRRANLARRAHDTVEVARRQMPNVIMHETFSRLEGPSLTLSSAATAFEAHEQFANVVAPSNTTLETRREPSSTPPSAYSAELGSGLRQRGMAHEFFALDLLASMQSAHRTIHWLPWEAHPARRSLPRFAEQPILLPVSDRIRRAVRTHSYLASPPGAPPLAFLDSTPELS